MFPVFVSLEFLSVSAKFHIFFVVLRFSNLFPLTPPSNTFSLLANVWQFENDILWGVAIKSFFVFTF